MEIENYRTYTLSKEYIKVEHIGGNRFSVQFKIIFENDDKLFSEVLEEIEKDDLKVIVGIL